MNLLPGVATNLSERHGPSRVLPWIESVSQRRSAAYEARRCVTLRRCVRNQEPDWSTVGLTASDDVPGYLRLIDTNTHGSRCDVTPLFEDGLAFAALTANLEHRLASVPFDVVAGIDALGFILGAALAVRAGTGFLPIRKVGKLPVPADHATFVDYSAQTKGLELRRGALTAGRRVLLVDEWIETGTQVRAAICLIERQEATVVAIAAIHIDVNDQTRELLATYLCITVQREEATGEDR